MSDARTEEKAMTEIADQLRGELNDTLDLIRRTGGGIVFEEFPGALEEHTAPVDQRDARYAGEASSATQRMLIEEANKLAERLEELRFGEYGSRQGVGRSQRER